MAKAMTKSEVASQMAEKVGITKKQASQFFETLADLAYKQAKNTFVLPGIGKLVLVERAARKMIMRFGEKAGQEITVPKKKVLKFRVAKAAKDAILGARSNRRAPIGCGRESRGSGRTIAARDPGGSRAFFAPFCRRNRFAEPAQR